MEYEDSILKTVKIAIFQNDPPGLAPSLLKPLLNLKC